jgi:hypothetical protein
MLLVDEKVAHFEGSLQAQRLATGAPQDVHVIDLPAGGTHPRPAEDAPAVSDGLIADWAMRENL